MELGQWIQLFGAVSSTASVREKSHWMMFCSGLIACTGVLLTILWVLVNGLEGPACIGLTALGLVLSLAWAALQQRLVAECAHWNRILRGIEGQFAGTEMHRGICRLLQGEQVCIPGAAWICGEWSPEAARFPILARRISGRVTQSVPMVFVLAFTALLIGILVVG